jgi:hypothetical protein
MCLRLAGSHSPAGDLATGYTSCKLPVTLIAQADNPGSNRGGGVARSAEPSRHPVSAEVHASHRRCVSLIGPEEISVDTGGCCDRAMTIWRKGEPGPISWGIRAKGANGMSRVSTQPVVYAMSHSVGGPRAKTVVEHAGHSELRGASCKRQADGTRRGSQTGCPNHRSRPM